MVTRKEVAERAGVSVATVSNVFNKKVYVRPETVRKVERAAAELKYVPNFTARTLSLGHSYQIAIAVSECTNPYHMEIFEAVSDYAADRGFMVTLFSVNERMRSSMNFLRERQFDAFINFSNQVYPEELIDLLKSKKTLLVNFGDMGLNFSVDVYKPTVAALEHLQALGHTRVGYVSTMDSLRWKADMRGRAFTEHLARLGLCEDENLIVYNSDYSALSEEVGYRNTVELLRRRRDFTALLTTNDLAALGAMRALREAGLAVPDDVSVIGCDGIESSRYAVPALSTIWYDKRAYGECIAEKIISCVRENRTPQGEIYRFESEYMPRESVAKVR